MTSHSVYSNHAGTLSDSYAIGKRGIKLLQGTAEPTGLPAPTGSLYIRRGDGAHRVYQIDAGGNWTTLLSPEHIEAGDNITIDAANGVVTISAPRAETKYKRTFSAASLGGGILTVEHNLNEDFPSVAVYNNSRTAILPDNIVSVDANTLTVDLNSYGAFSGTWNVTVIAS